MKMRAETRHHTATVCTVVHEAGTEDELRVIDSVEFNCTAPEDASCRTYPDCECETFTEDSDNPGFDDSGHPYRPGQGCWVKDWFDAMPNAESTVYVGADGDDSRHDGWLPAIDRTGHVKIVACDIETGPEWEWEAMRDE